MRDIQAAGARIVVCNLPEGVRTVLRGLPGLRSQLPIAESVDEARASLRASNVDATDVPEHAVLLALLEGSDVAVGAKLASSAAKEIRASVVGVCLVEVARNLPLASPLPDAEADANLRVQAAGVELKRLSVPFTGHIERVRDCADGLLTSIRDHQASVVVVAVPPGLAVAERMRSLLDTVLRRAPCTVVIARGALDAEAYGVGGMGSQ
jgi:hypothetical protein